MSYTYYTRHIIQVCGDCLHVSHSGPPDYEGYADTGHAERYAAAVARVGDEPTARVVGDTELKPSFSWSPCDFCDDTLGGERYECVVSERATVD